jgi:hypothetical protein
VFIFNSSPYPNLSSTWQFSISNLCLFVYFIDNHAFSNANYVLIFNFRANFTQASSKLLESKRAKALEFASKRVPKPRVAAGSKISRKQDVKRLGDDESYLTADDEFGGNYELAG